MRIQHKLIKENVKTATWQADPAQESQIPLAEFLQATVESFGVQYKQWRQAVRAQATTETRKWPMGGFEHAPCASDWDFDPNVAE